MRPSKPTTVGEFAAQWGMLAPRDSLNTLVHNEQMVRAWVDRYGGLPLDKPPARFAVDWFARNHPTKIRYVKTFYSDAKRLGLCAENPFAGVKSPTSPGRAGVIPPSEAQVLAAARSAEPNFADVILFCWGTGCRLGEMVTVQAGDVLSESRLRVRGKRVAGRDGVREVSLLGPARDVVWRRTPEVGLVFRTVGGRRWTKESVSRAWCACRGAGRIEDSFHMLRHACATRLLDAGASELDVATQLGHFDKFGRPSVDQVRRIYGHPDKDLALRRLEEL